MTLPLAIAAFTALLAFTAGLRRVFAHPSHRAVVPADRRPGADDERITAATAPLRIIAGTSPPPRSPRGRSGGFSLIEMLCTVTVAGLLSSVAYPAYQGTVTKSRRADALAATLAVQAAQERFRAGSVVYGSLAEIGASTRSPSGHYALSVVAPSATGYTLLAAASGSQSADRDCRYLKLTAEGADLRYASGNSESAANDDATNRRCWNL